MADKNKAKVFLDSSGLIAGVMSTSRDAASRQLLRLGELGVIALCVSREVLTDAERIIVKRRSTLLPELALVIHTANIVTVMDPYRATVDACMDMTGYRPDARVLAAAVECEADLFVTFDEEHFLQNPLIGPPNTKLRVCNAYQALEWTRAFLLKTSED